MGPELQVAIDVGSRIHRVAVGDADGHILDQFDIHHTARGMDEFFDRVTPLAGTARGQVWHSDICEPCGLPAVLRSR